MAIDTTSMVDGWVGGSSESSPDPLTLSSNTFPKLTTPIRARSNTPLSKRPLRSTKKELMLGDAVNIRKSPSKSITMDTPGGASPWRIKVTVEAQSPDNDDEVDYHNSKPPKKRKFATGVTKTTVPLKDADESPPSRGRKKPRRSTGASTGIRKRKPTPAKRKSNCKLDSTLILSDINVESSPTEQPHRERSLSHDLSQPGNTAEPTHDSETGLLLESLGDDQNMTVAPVPVTKIPPNEVQRSAFDFSALTPLHQKHSLQPPETQGNFRETQEKHKQGRAAILPQGWSAPVFSPLPPRSSPVRTQKSSHQKMAAPTDVDHINFPTSPSQEKSYNDVSDDDSLEDSGGDADADKEGDTHDDAELWKKMVKRSDEFGDEQIATDGASETSSEDEDFVMADEITGVVGDATMMQSEEFSMVSVSSLPSAKNLHSGLVENGSVKTTLAKSTERRSKQSSPHSTNPAPVTTSDNNGKQTLESANSQLTYEQLLGHLPSKEVPITTPTMRSKSTTTQVMLDASQDVSMATEPETPIQASLSIQNMSSLMRSWRRNLPPQEQSFTTGSQNKDTPTKTNLSAVTAMGTAMLNPQDPPPASNLPPNAARDGIPDVARLPTPNSAERDPYDMDNQSSHISESEATHQSLRSRLQEAASKQLRNESDRAYVNETDVSTEDEQEPSLNNTNLLREAQWQCEREEVIRQAKEANESCVIIIQSDSEQEEDEELDEERQQTQNYDVDIWQEEASRSTLLDDQQGKRKARETDRTLLEQPEHSLSNYSTESKPRPSKVSRSWRRISAGDVSYNCGATNRHSVDKTGFRKLPATDPEHVHQKENNTIINSLFRSITGRSQSPTKEQSGKEVEEKQKAETLDYEASTLSTADELEEGDEEHDTQSLASCNDIATQHSPHCMNDSIEFADLPDASMTSTSVMSPTKLNSTMLSDVRQLHREMHLASYHVTAIEEVSSNHVAEKTFATRASQSMLHLSPKRQFAKPLFDKSDITAANHLRPFSKRNSSSKEPLPVISPLHPASAPSILTRIWQIFTVPPTRPSHPALQKLPLLPKYEPWTRTHYKVLDALWQHYKRYPSTFAPGDSRNQGVLAQKSEWRRYVDIEFMNWGYGVRMDKPLIVLAILFNQLLVLENGREFEQVQGVRIDGADVGPWASEEEKMEIEPLTVLVRLFSVICGEMVRKDEARGRRIDRSEGGGDGVRWRFRGREDWVWANIEILGMRKRKNVVG